METFSAPVRSRIVIWPEIIPRARNWPSLAHAADRILDCTLYLATDFSVGDHRPKSVLVQEARMSLVGLYTTFCTESACVYLRIGSPFSDQMITQQSAPPDANRLPSLSKSTVYTVSLCPRRDSSRSPSAAL